MNLTTKRLPDWDFDWEPFGKCPECGVPLRTLVQAQVATPDDEYGISTQYTGLVCSEACAQEFAKHPVESLEKRYAA